MKKKKFFRLGQVLLIAAVLAILFNGCKDPDPTYYTVTFDINDEDVTGASTAPAPITNVASGSTITAPANPTSTSHNFAGWYKEAAGTNAWNFETDTVTEDLTLYAKWTTITYTVTFDINAAGVTGASATPNPTTGVQPGATITAPTAPTSTSHTFVGWFTHATAGVQWVFATSTVTGNITLYARWTNVMYTITFNMNAPGTANGVQGQPAAVEIPQGGLITRPTDPTSTNYNFTGWWTLATGGDEWNFTAGTVTAARTLFGRWAVKTYNVTFNINDNGVTGATGLPAINPAVVNHGATVTRPATDPTSTSHTFAGWFTTPNTGGTEFNFTTPITVATTIYARWTIRTYTVNFDRNYNSVSGLYGISGAIPPATGVEHGTTVNAPTTPPTSTNYTFVAWFTASTGGTAWNFTDPITENRTLYATWAIKTYTVTFDLNATGVTNPTGLPPPIPNVNHGATIATAPYPVPLSDSHNFAGWYRETGTTTPWVFGPAGTTVTSAATLYARWVMKTPLELDDLRYFWDNEKNTIVISATSRILSLGGYVNITGPGTSDYTNWVWSINGIVDATQTGSNFRFCSLGRSPGNYRIGLLVKYKDEWYSAEITIEVQGQGGN
jgi:uncharacterized repeat protein (TIGR02543 family)